MDLSGALINGLLTVVGYTVIFLGVYKVFQIATDIREIKDMVAKARGNSVDFTRPTPVIARTVAPVIARDPIADDPSAYAEQLLRAVNADSQVKETEVR